MKFPFQTWFWINRRLLYIEMPFSYIKLFNWENIDYFAYPPEALFWSLKDGKYIHCRWMTSFVYLRNLATSDIPISGFPGCSWPRWLSRMCVWLVSRRLRVQYPPGPATFFCGEWSWYIFYSHSLPSFDSRRVVVSFQQKNVLKYWAQLFKTNDVVS